MPTIDSQSGVRVEEIATGIFQIHLPVPPAAIAIPGGFSFNQYLLLDDEPLLFHTGPRRSFEAVRKAIAHVMPVEKLRHVAYSHCESDECGSMNQLLAIAPRATPVTGAVGAMLNGDLADREGRGLEDGEVLTTGRRSYRWFATPHLPHGWECGYLLEESSKTLLCGDLFTQGGAFEPALVTSELVGPSEAMRKGMDYFAHSPSTGPMLERLAATNPSLLACMHGSAFQGDGAGALRELARRLAA